MKLQRLFFVLFCVCNSLFAVINTFEDSYSVKHNINTPFTSISMEEINVDALLLEDEQNRGMGVPMRYAHAFDVDFGIENAGTWEELEDGSKIWRIGIHSTGAYGMKVLFDALYLPEGSEMYVYSAYENMSVGPYMHAHNQPDETFGIPLVRSDRIVVEYYQPSTVTTSPKLNIQTVYHAYIDIHNFYDARDDRNCGENVACSSADTYDDLVDSGIYMEMGGYICSAALINNTAEDKTPYVLTAWHCVESETSVGDHNYFTFYFNHQASSCGGNSGNYSNSQTGSYLRSWGNTNTSDFALLEMDNDPPSYWDPHFAGWDRGTSAPTIAVGIHHPGGEPKKINFDDDQAYGCNWYGSQTHWCFEWDEGGTEGGSSGSPVFDNSGLIVGQLSGGAGAECGEGVEHYGKFSTSWSNSTNPQYNLKDWLDPLDSGAYTLDGTYDGVIFAGCTDPEACNYDPDATEDDGGCLFNDCAGECDGDAVEDECGVCNGSGIPDGACDCVGNTFIDACGVCGGDSSSCEDNCGIPNGDNSSCADECGVPNGDGSDCANCSLGGQWTETIPDNVTVLAGGNVFCNEDIGALEQLRITNNLAVDHPLLVGNQTWRYGKLRILVASYNPNGSGGVDTQLTEIPPEFGELTELTSLYLEMNQLTSLPDEFAQLTNLTSLTISNNYLTGLPEDFGNLTDLFFLDLGYNQLESIPESICELQSLYYFYLFNNNLTDLPECMCELPVDWNGFDGGGYPFYGSGANQLCYDIPDCIEESDNFELSLDQFYYSTVLDEPQDCPWTYLEAYPVDDTIELYWESGDPDVPDIDPTRGSSTDTYTLSLENLDLWGRAGTVEIWMDNPGAVAGFQINLDGMGITNLSGGSAEANGFTVANASSGGEEIVLGFSFTGAVIDPSNGPEHLTTITFDSEEGAGICFADAVLSDASGQPLEVAYDTECVYWQNCDDPSACNYGEGGDCEYDSCAEGPFQIFFSSEVEIGGFQISLPDANITDGYGGAAADAGFTISTSSNLVLGFSFSGNTIPAGSGVLVELDVETPHEEICIDSATLSDAYGNGLELWIESCNTIHIIQETAGCMDESACNYNLEATEDDGSCEYPDPFYDCEGNCTNDPDGDGVCDDSIFTYNVYRDGSLYIELLVDPEFIDDVGYYSNHCYTVTYTNNIYGQESDHSNEACTATGGPDDIYGCMDENACNYNPDATIDDNTCDEDCGPPECLYDCPNMEEYFADLQDPSTTDICGYFGSMPLGFNNPCIDDCEEDVSQELAALELCCPSIEGGACDCDIEEFDEGFTVTPEYEDCTGECGGYAQDDLCGICDGDNAYNRNAISTGMYHSLTLLEDGSVMAWGDNSFGQLGDGTVDDSFTAVAVIGLNDIVYVAAGSHHSFAIESDGTLWAWGLNEAGQLGIGNTIDQHVPVEVETIGEAVIAVAGGYNHSIALTDDGKVYTWGSSGDGALGNGASIPNSTNILYPEQMVCPGTGSADAIAAGQNKSYIIDSDANGWAFGSNSNGQLGDGTTNHSSTPVSISTINDIKMIANGLGWGRHTLALLHDGTVWAWGDNERGQLGVDTTLSQTFEPIEVTSINNVIDISAGSGHSMALKSDGRVWVWGANDQGQLGDDTYNDSSVPIVVAPMSNVIDASAGGDLSIAYHALDFNGYQIAYWGSFGGNWPTAADGFSVQIGIVEGPDVDCNGECFGSAEEDECGECDNDSSNDCVQDCGDIWGGDLIEDCAGVCDGDSVIDECGVCDSDSSNDCTQGCDGVWGSGLVEDCTGVCGGSAENCPDWQDDPGAYEFVATLVGGIVLDQGTQLGDAGDMLATLDADGNVRGVAVQLSPTFGPYANSIVYEMTMRSNSAGDILYFKYYDASQDAILDIAGTYTFVINEQLGNVINPYVLNISYAIDMTFNLIAGYNWISFNVAPDDNSLSTMLASLGDDALFIISQTSGSATNYGEYGWFGSLENLGNTEMYKIEMATDKTLTVTGVPVDVVSTPINLIAGYNWVGYTPQNAGPLPEALASLGDDAMFMNSQVDGASTNYGEYGWFGSLETLQPGTGYLLEMEAPGVLIYPDFNGLTRTVHNKKPVELTSAISDWDFNYAEYQFSGVITTAIENRIDSENDIVAVFVDGMCRGIAERMYFPFDDSYMYIIQVYSNVEEGEELSFKYYDAKNDKIIEYHETLEFTNYMNVGNGFNTFALTGEIQPGVYTFTDAYPNPFNPTTEFTYVIGEAGMINISVYDINGRLVTALANGYTTPGSYIARWNASDISSGMYLIHMTANNHTAMQKVMLIK